MSTMLGNIVDRVTEPWGVAVDRVQIKDVEIPQSMQRAMVWLRRRWRSSCAACRC